MRGGPLSDNELSHAELKRRLRHAEESLAQCERIAIANQFTAAVIHEVNNPLEAITNLTYLLELDKGLSLNSREYLAILKDQLAVLTHVTRTSLSFYRDQLHAQNVDLVAIAQASLKLHFAKLTRSNIRVHTRFADRAVSSVIASEILQVLSNLLLNAMDVLPAAVDPVIHLRVHRRHHGIHIVIADNGPGIPDEVEARLFDAHVTGKSTGTGMGLWLSKGLVTKHGGRIRFRTSRKEGKSGTVFRVWFPHADAA